MDSEARSIKVDPLRGEDPERKEKETISTKGELKDETADLSEQDAALKEELDTAVTGLLSATTKTEMEKILGALATIVQGSVSSLTSVPKPLKFLRPHFENLFAFFEKNAPAPALFADLLSVLAMTKADEGDHCLALKLKLQGNRADIADWGSEYARCLTLQVAQEFARRQEQEQSTGDLQEIIDLLVPYYMKQNAEPEACDLLFECGQIAAIEASVDKNNFERVCLYLAGFAAFVPGPQDTEILRLVMGLYHKHDKPTEALRFAIRLHDKQEVKNIFHGVGKDKHALRSQMAFMLGEQRMFILDDEDEAMDQDQDMNEEEEEREEALRRQTNNAHISEAFLVLAEDLDTLEPKVAEDIYKSHLEASRAGNSSANTTTGVDSARGNLATTFVNAFVNAGYGHDKLMTDNVGHEWIYKNKEHGMMCAAASLGCVLLWDVDNALSQIDTLLEFSSENWIKAGALLSVGIVNSGVRHEVDPAMTLLGDYVDGSSGNTSVPVQLGALLGLGLAYAGAERADVLELLVTIVEGEAPLDVVGHAALSLGLVFVGTGNTEVVEALLGVYLERAEELEKSTHARFVALGLGLVFFARQDDASVTLATLSAFEGTAGAYAHMTVKTCAFAGTGNVLMIQELLHQLVEAEQTEEDDVGDDGLKDDADRPEGDAAKKEKETPDGHPKLGPAVLGIALIALGEPVGTEMSRRMFEHLLQYGDPVVRRAVPMALALTHLSNPDIYAVDTLSKLSHDQSPDVAQTAILALGLVGAGTNNARIAANLRNLAGWYQNAPTVLFAVRLAQGLTHMGKGLMTLNPFTSGGLLMSKVAIGGLLAVAHAALDMDGLLMGVYAHLMFCVVTAMRPRMLITYNAQGEILNVPVRVGKAVDTVAQAGKPKTISGFTTHMSPVLLGTGERCELATDEYIALTSVLENVVILEKNPDAQPKSKAQLKEEARAKKEREAKRKKRLEARGKEGGEE